MYLESKETINYEQCFIILIKAEFSSLKPQIIDLRFNDVF
jgi:hypothetical protein